MSSLNAHVTTWETGSLPTPLSEALNLRKLRLFCSTENTRVFLSLIVCSFNFQENKTKQNNLEFGALRPESICNLQIFSSRMKKSSELFLRVPAGLLGVPSLEDTLQVMGTQPSPRVRVRPSPTCLIPGVCVADPSEEFQIAGRILPPE